MRHTEAYKRRAISDTIKMCISRRCFKRNPRPVTPPGVVYARAYFTYTIFYFVTVRLYLPEEIIMLRHTRARARAHNRTRTRRLLAAFCAQRVAN